MTTPDERPLVLIIEDNQELANALSRLLDKWGFSNLAAGSSGAAIRVLAGRIKNVHALITDYHLQDGFTGIKGAIAVANAIGHPVPTLVTTGSRDLADHPDAFPVLAKPYDPDVLHQWLNFHLERDAAQKHHWWVASDYNLDNANRPHPTYLAVTKTNAYLA